MAYQSTAKTNADGGMFGPPRNRLPYQRGMGASTYEVAGKGGAEKDRKTFVSFPHVTADWEIDFKKRGTIGAVKAALTRIGAILGFGKCA